MYVSSNYYYYLLYALYRNKRLLTVHDWVYDPLTPATLVSFSCPSWQMTRSIDYVASTPRKDSGDLRSVVSLALYDVWIRRRIATKREITKRPRGKDGSLRLHKIMYPGYISAARYHALIRSACTPAYANLPSISMTISRRCRAWLSSAKRSWTRRRN